jgi:hypothetical protein
MIRAIYKSTIDEDLYNIKAAHAACARLPQLPVEVWDEIGMWVVQDHALNWLCDNMLGLRSQWREICEIELHGDFLLALFPATVEEVVGNPIVAAFHEHFGQCVGARIGYEYWAERLFGMCHDLGHPQLETAYRADSWHIRYAVRNATVFI